MYLCAPIDVAKMPIIANKSDFNLQAAEELIKKNLYAPSVHCSYYGCFQKMKFILSRCFKITYEEIDQIVANSRPKRSEHVFIRDKIVHDLSGKKSNIQFSRTLENNIKRLYQFRINSDYKNMEIFSNTASEAMRISKDIIIQLKKIYSI